MTTSYNPFSLEGKKILVVGASSGIGKSSAIECSKMGAEVFAVARNIERLQETKDLMQTPGSSIIKCDLLNEKEVTELVSCIPPLDGVVICPGVGETLPLQFATRKKIDRVFNTNLFANVELIRLLVKNKKIKKEGSIVALASVGGLYNFNVGNGMYGASKAALNSWMKFLAMELAPKQIRVNSICPGMVVTPLIDPGKISAEQLEEDKKNYPLKRYGTPEEIAYAVIYFLSDASKWVTGTSFVIDGGLTI